MFYSIVFQQSARMIPTNLCKSQASVTSLCNRVRTWGWDSGRFILPCVHVYPVKL